MDEGCILSLVFYSLLYPMVFHFMNLIPIRLILLSSILSLFYRLITLYPLHLALHPFFELFIIYPYYHILQLHFYSFCRISNLLGLIEGLYPLLGPSALGVLKCAILCLLCLVLLQLANTLHFTMDLLDYFTYSTSCIHPLYPLRLPSYSFTALVYYQLQI